METAPITCPKCGDQIKNIPAGISKSSGKKYEEFWACSNRKCDFTWNTPKKNNSDPPFQGIDPTKTPDLEVIKNGLGLIRGDIVRLEKKIDKIEDILARGSVYYPKDEPE